MEKKTIPSVADFAFAIVEARPRVQNPNVEPSLHIVDLRSDSGVEFINSMDTLTYSYIFTGVDKSDVHI